MKSTHSPLVHSLTAAALIVLSAACQAQPPAEPATLIVHNAQVYTAHAAQPMGLSQR